MRLISIFLLALGLVGCSTSEKTIGVRVKGHEKLAALTKTLGENIDKTAEGYHARLAQLYDKINTKTFATKLKALADTNGRADIKAVGELIMKWESIKTAVHSELEALREEAAMTKADLAKIQVIVAALEDLAQAESASGQLDAAHVASILSRISDVAASVQAVQAQKQKEKDDKEFEDLVKELNAPKEE